MAPGAFVENDLKQHFSDILYSMRIAGQTGYIYTLIEHVSQAKALTPFQILRYQIAAMKQHTDQGHNKLPVVIPMLFYRGEQSPYPGPLDIIACFDNPDLAKEVLFKPCKLIDLSIIPDEELKTHKSIALLELLQKHILVRDVLELAQYLVDQSLYRPLSVNHFQSVLHYIEGVGQSSDYRAFIQFLEHSSIDLEYQKAMQTIADSLRNEGLQQGMQASYSDVWEAAARKAKLETAKRMLAQGLSMDFIKQVTDLSEDALL